MPCLMERLELTLDTPAENLALDEALLHAYEAGELPRGGVLRLWESPQPVVVVGRATRLAQEVDAVACRQLGIPILRRVSGGMTILAGPGCLMYAVVAPFPSRTGNDINQLHQYVLEGIARPLQQLGFPAQLAGTSDLVLAALPKASRKVSGNSLRLSRNAFLYHGTLLYDYDLSLIQRCLLPPPRSPDYRDGRDHESFVANLNSDRDILSQAIAESWNAHENLADWPRERVAQLVRDRYERTEWNEGR